jgi:hypothetical protein
MDMLAYGPSIPSSLVSCAGANGVIVVSGEDSDSCWCGMEPSPLAENVVVAVLLLELPQPVLGTEPQPEEGVLFVAETLLLPQPPPVCMGMLPHPVACRLLRRSCNGPKPWRVGGGFNKKPDFMVVWMLQNLC